MASSSAATGGASASGSSEEYQGVSAMSLSGFGRFFPYMREERYPKHLAVNFRNLKVSRIFTLVLLANCIECLALHPCVGTNAADAPAEHVQLRVSNLPVVVIAASSASKVRTEV